MNSLPWQQGEPGAYLEALRALFGADNRQELLDSEQWPDVTLARLCADALLLDVERDSVEGLIRERDLQPDGPDVVRWPWAVRIYTLGRFSLVKDGQAVEFNGKSPRKPLELLKALIALGGRDVNCISLMHALWPDEDSRDLRKVFDNTLHRLRRVLGYEDAILVSDGKLTLSLRRCWVDAWAFDRLSDKVCGEELSSTRLADEARRLYQGHFLQREVDEAWLLPYRDRLRSRFARFVMSYGARQELEARWEAAAELYARAIEVDNLAEGFYRRLMACHYHRGEFAEAMQTYRRCRELLSIVLGVKPSRETEELRRQVEEAGADHR